MNCPLCHGSARFWRKLGDRFYKWTEVEVDYFRCQQCGLVFQNPMPTREIAATFYGDGYWGEQKNAGFIAKSQSLYINWMLRSDLLKWVFNMRLQPGSRFLDFGCSRGDFLDLVKEQGFDVFGCDGDERAAAYARKNYGIDVECVSAEDWQPKPNYFHGISMFHVLEHVSEPLELLNKCHLALRQGGKLLIRVPHFGSIQRILTQGHWKGLEAPRHLWQWTLPSIKMALGQAGFKIVKKSTWSLRDGPPAFSSTIFPSGEPTRQQVLGRGNPILTLAYLVLTWAVSPFELLASLLQKGAMITVIAEKQSL